MSTIASRAKRSLALLERLIELLKKPGQESIGLFASEAVDALDRFRIWASNIGAFQDINVKSSLEYRIRDAPKIANQITELLGELIESLEDIYSIASHARENRTGALHEAEIDPSAHLLEANEDTQIENSDEEELSEVREILASIEDAISNLFRFSIIIRNNTSRDRYAKAATAAIATPFNGQFDICHVEHKFPALAKRNCRWLIERLGKAVTQRREYLKYCREHHDKTATEPQRPEPGTLTIPPIESSSQIPARSIAVARSDYSKPTSTLAPTQASTLILTSGQVIEEELEEEAQSQTSYATSTDEDSSDTALSVINLEEVSKGFKQFECPYCWQIQTARSQNAWKKHVLSDLKPYVCTFEKCELKLFSDRHTWFSHELKDHRQEWRCYFCSHHPFNDADKYKRHLASHHSDSLVQDQFSALLEMSQNALAKFSPTDCPFCDDWERRLRIINPHIPIVEALAVTPSQFQRHLGAHMEQLALFAIPRGYTEEGEADSGNAAPQVDSNSSFGNSRVSSNLGWQLRLCEDIMNALTEYTHVGYLSEPTALPPFYLWIPPCGQVKILPLSIPKIVQKLESGEYQEADDLYLDMQVLFAILDLTHETGDHANIRSLFDALWADRVGNVQKGLIRWLVLDPRRIRKQICWKLWTAKALSTRHIDTSPSAMIVTMKMLDGEQVTRSFDKAASMEYLYMFADCYELIGVLPNLSLPILEEDYQHDFHFMLNLAGDTSTSGRCRLDPRISIGQITEISTDFVVLDLGAKQRAELGRTFFEPLIEEKGKSVHVVTGHKQTTRVKENMEPPCVDAEEQQMAGSAIETRHDSEGTIQDLTNMEPDEEWSISAVDKEDSDSLYSSLDKDKKGYVTDIEASKFLYAWGISEDILGQIWALLDIKSTGYLTRDEFRVAMYLCRKARQDNGESLPKTLPLSLILPSMRRLHHLSAEFDEKQDVDEDEERWQNSPGKEIRLSSVNVNTVGLSSKYLGGRLATSDRPIPPDTQQVSPISEPMSPILDEGEVPTPPIGAGKARADSFLDSESESRDSAISNESIFPAPPTDYVDADYWTKEQVTYFLTTHVFSDDWQRTIRALEITGSDFLNLGRRLGLKDGPHLMHSKVFPRLASECKESGRGWNEDTEREEGKRLRRLIRGLVAETKQVAENNLSVTPYPKVSVVLSDNAGDRKTYGTLRKGDIVTFIRAEPSGECPLEIRQGEAHHKNRLVPGSDSRWRSRGSS
ncbi:hypothetical protein BKA64DRAFT_450220 [Cadophora sp. MPI-SDFR-AT-0126]|nr:hypothetical protein BKA64DRAFT_450220 [Leotiomycetes sp. MPI-SDFR-AT-0126]